MFAYLVEYLKCLILNEGASLADMRAELVELQAAAQAIQDKADADGRALTEDEEIELNAALDKFEALSAEYDRRARLDSMNRATAEPAARRTTADNRMSARPGARASGGAPAGTASGANGFTSFGDFAKAVKASAGEGSQVDNRLIRNQPGASTTGTEGVGPDGGFAVPPDFRREIVEIIEAEDQLLGRTDILETSSNMLTVPVDESTPWGSTGVQAYWTGEAAQLTQSKPALQQRNVPLHKLTCLVPITEELAEDAPALDTWLRTTAADAINHKVSDAIFAGTGAGQPLGILNAPGTISVAKEGGQAADTIVFNNINKMWMRMYGPSRAGAVWLINQDVEPQLTLLEFPGDSSPVYIPAGAGLAARPFDTLKGRPVLPHQVCKTLGDKGDIALVNLRRYMAVRRTNGIRADVSMHLWFDYDALAYKFVFRIGGQPWWSAPVSPANGSTTYSPFIVLDERA